MLTLLITEEKGGKGQFILKHAEENIWLKSDGGLTGDRNDRSLIFTFVPFMQIANTMAIRMPSNRAPLLTGTSAEPEGKAGKYVRVVNNKAILVSRPGPCKMAIVKGRTTVQLEDSNVHVRIAMVNQTTALIKTANNQDLIPGSLLYKLGTLHCIPCCTF